MFWTEQAEQLSLWRAMPKPRGHRFFHDCSRETYARAIEWAMGLGQAWFVTQTFENECSMSSAEVAYGRWAGRLTEACAARGQRLSWVRATEWQQRGVVHYHSLLISGELHSHSRKRWEGRWERGGFNNGYCRTYDAVHSAAPYLAKYMNKDRGGDLHWGGTWRGLSVPTSTQCCAAPPGDSGATGGLAVTVS